MRRSFLSGIYELPYFAPAVALTVFVVLVPTAVVVFRSFYAWDPGYSSPFVGLDNYTFLWHSDAFRTILVNEFFFLIGLPLWTLLPIVVALLLHDRVPVPSVFRTIFFLPAILPAAILGILFRSLLARDGAVNGALRGVGLPGLAHDWLNDPSLVKPVLIVILTWAGLGTGVVIFSAALSTVPQELFEAAELEGAGWWQRLRYVVLPSLWPVVQLWMAFQVVSIFLYTFGWIYVLTAGGPGYSSTTFDYDVYTNAITNGDFGLASAEAVTLLAIVIAIVVVVNFVLRSKGRRSLARILRIRRRPARPDYPPGPSPARSPVRSRIERMRGALSAAAATRRRRRGAPFITARGHWRRSPLRTALLAVLALCYLYPFVFLGLTALKTAGAFNRDTVGFSTDLTFEHVRSAWGRASLGQATLNSLEAVGLATVICVAVSAPAAFWFLRHSGWLSKAVVGVMVSLWILPYVVFIIPLFVLLSRIGLANNLVMLALVYAATNVPFGIYLIYSYYKSGLPDDLLEAAEVDGASTWQVFTRIVIPLSAPVLATLAALTFVWSWGDLTAAVVLMQEPSKWTVTVAASSLVSRFDVHTQEGAAAALIGIVPLVIVFLFAQRAIVKGITAGLGK
jgi:ABC-type sugar transport system permease subunit